jgi:hypothetical protein
MPTINRYHSCLLHKKKIIKEYELFPAIDRTQLAEEIPYIKKEISFE